MSVFDLHTFFICFKLLLKYLGVRVEFFNTGNLHKNLNNRILKHILDRFKPTQSQNSSSSLNLLRILPCFPTMLMIFSLAPFKRFSYFWTSDIPSFKLFAFFTSSFRFAFSSSETSRIHSCNSFFSHSRATINEKKYQNPFADLVSTVKVLDLTLHTWLKKLS